MRVTQYAPFVPFLGQVSWFFSFTTQCFLRFINVVALNSNSLFLTFESSHYMVYHNLFNIYLLAHVHFCYLKARQLYRQRLLKHSLQVFVCIHTYISYANTSSGIPGLSDKSMYNFIRKGQTVFQSGSPFYKTNEQCVRSSAVLHFTQQLILSRLKF